MKWLFVLFALVAGGLMPVQAGVNLRLREALGGALWATTVSFAVGAMTMFFYVLVSRTPVPTGQMATSAPWWAWTGGLLGPCFVFASIVLAARLGATTTMAWLLAGQMLAALFLDHFGLVSFAVHPISWQRVTGVILLIIGAVMVNKY